MVRVACSNDSAAKVPAARMTSGASATNSPACLRLSWTSPPAHRVSIRTLRPSIQPNERLPLALLRARGNRPCCGRTANEREEFAPFHLLHIAVGRRLFTFMPHFFVRDLLLRLFA